MIPTRLTIRAAAVALATLSTFAAPTFAQSITEGTGRVDALSDSFDDPAWSYDNAQQRSTNGKWRQSFRGVPETLQRVAPPAAGVPGSSGALSIRSVDNGDDGYPTQEDFLTQDYASGFGRYPLRRDQPTITTRVYLPPVSELETTWYQFGFRTEARSNQRVGGVDALGRYYPSIWITSNPQPAAPSSLTRPYFTVRLGDGYTSDTFPASPYLSQTGWWTLGLQFDEQGVVHYYASPGADALVEANRIFSSTMFATSHPSGQNPQMDSLAYSFYSIGYPQGPQNSLGVVVDEFEVRVVPEPASAILLGVLMLMLHRRRRDLEPQR